MKITPIKIAAAALILTSLSLASCASSGYGCDYGAIEANNSNDQDIELCLETECEEKFVIVDYRKVSRP